MNSVCINYNNAEETVSFQHKVNDTKRLNYFSVEKVVELIQSGGNYKPIIMNVRAALRSNDKKSADLHKKQLPAVVFAGKFRSADKSGLLQHSGLMVVDFDGVPEIDLQRHKQELADHPSTRLVFISPSGTGLKWVVAVSATDGATHKRCFDLCVGEVSKRFPGLSGCLDTTGCDVSRRSFMSFDPEVQERIPTQQIGTESDQRQGCEVECQNAMSGRNGGKDRTVSNRVELGEVACSPPHSSGEAGRTLAQRVQPLVPQQGRQNHDSLFHLARLCRDLETEMGVPPFDLPPAVQDEVFRLWMSMTPDAFRRHSEGDYWDEFTQKFHDAKLGLSCAPWRVAWNRSKTEPPPAWWKSVIRYPEEKRLRLLSMLHIQSKLTGNRVIAPVESIALAAEEESYDDLDHPQKVNRVLKGFRTVLKLVAKASLSPRRAAIYELHPPPLNSQLEQPVPEEGCLQT
jgi:hypothetical protein